MCITVARSKVLTFVEVYAIIVDHVLWWLHFKSLSLVLNVRAWALGLSHTPRTPLTTSTLEASNGGRQLFVKERLNRVKIHARESKIYRDKL